MSDRMFELADRLKELRDAKKQAEQRVKDINASIDGVDYELSELMAQTETQSFSRAGTLFYLTTTTRASAVTESKTELYDALKREGFGDLVYETVNANSLSAFVREQKSENEDVLPGWMEGLVTVYEKTSVGVRRSEYRRYKEQSDKSKDTLSHIQIQNYGGILSWLRMN